MSKDQASIRFAIAGESGKKRIDSAMTTSYNLPSSWFTHKLKSVPAGSEADGELNLSTKTVAYYKWWINR